MTSDAAELSERLTRTVRAVPGVTDVYDAGPTIARMAAATVNAALRREPTGLVRVAGGSAGPSVAVHIAVSEAGSAAETCRHVYDAVLAQLISDGYPDTTPVKVTVGRIS